MSKFIVYLAAVVSTSVEVEADSGEEAIEEAIYQGVPGLMFLDHTYPDVGDWTTPSEMYPEWNKPEDDYMEVPE